MHPRSLQVPTWQVPFGAHVSSIEQSDGFPQYTVGAPLELLELLELLDDELEELDDELDSPLELVDDELLDDELLVSTSQLAVRSDRTTQVCSLGQPQMVQSPGWHILSEPQVSLNEQSAEVTQELAGWQLVPWQSGSGSKFGSPSS
jgi:hypothetical protein